MGSEGFGGWVRLVFVRLPGSVVVLLLVLDGFKAVL